jgi:hypothetical protein
MRCIKSKANFGTIDGVNAMLTAFSPLDFGSLPLSSSPCAFCQIGLVNTGSNAVDVAIGLQASTANAPLYVASKGLKNDAGDLMRAVYAASDDASTVISVGNDSFLLSDRLSGGRPSPPNELGALFSFSCRAVVYRLYSILQIQAQSPCLCMASPL